MAAARPAGPAPTMTTSNCMLSRSMTSGSLQAIAPPRCRRKLHGAGARWQEMLPLPPALT
jgi:hypothetical protein